ncbi:MAG TPA: site-2 protease family protein [Anaerolineales bacterium]|nr:site-2 protease family protein [Anaerolineales bacterium]HMV95646.1 site-2 protease family protein [Anaerolineales bacterium]HMZ45015.1 site-2 protease family protein [Anaerolineales bacterium]HNA52969.1 site-2 protease family protein [Anaerolineales bacterium]HNB85211.1 site-2 protease family protein [Anaerolineales bacterium]
MKWQWKLGKFAGIDVYVHATFLLLIGWVGYSHWLEHRNWGEVLNGILFILALFVCVILHEYGHALTARKYGIKTRDITLYPIGGVARLERMPEKPIEELWVALMGPAVNVVIAAGLFAYLYLTSSLVPLNELTIASGNFLERLMTVNLSLVLFNLIPAFPMDGGRVLRALLAMRMDYVRATQIAATIGQGMALLFGLVGLFGNATLLFIAFFIWIGASQESGATQMKNAISGIPVGRAMLTEYKSLSPRDTLARMSQLLLAGSQHDFPVIDGERIVGVVTRDDFLMALTQHGEGIAISAVMKRDLPEVDSYEMVENALLRIQESGVPALPVTHGGQLVGIVTAENIAEYLMIRSALRASRMAVPL